MAKSPFVFQSLGQLCADAKSEMDQHKLLEESKIPRDEAQIARVKLYTEIKRLIDHLEEPPSPAVSTTAVTGG